jgi:tRNA (cmo5U34)-methyltransferase
MRIADYDRQIRVLIPGYEPMRHVQLVLLAGVLEGTSGGLVIDLGGGTGSLAAAIAEAHANAEVEIWDTDAAMLEIARERCAKYGARVRAVERSYFEPLPPCTAVVACIALHHVKDLAEKGKLYANIHAALRPGGLFANADTCMSTVPFVQAQCYRDWMRFMGTHGIDELQARKHFDAWALEDYCPPVCEELRLLGNAGFKESDVFWREAPFVVFGGVRR